MSVRRSAPPAADALVVSGDPVLVDEIGRLAAATGAVPRVVDDPVEARQVWGDVSMVLVGDDRATAVTGLRLPRRDGVLLVTAGGPEVASWRRAVEIGAEQVLSVYDDRDRLVEVLGAGGAGAANGPIVSVTGACGGAGASVFAAALATTARARGESVVLVDGDPWGGGVDLLVGAEDSAGLRWPDLAATSGRISAASLRELLPVVDDLAVLSWGRDDPVPLSGASMRAVLTAARHGHHLVVADLARHDDDATLEALALSMCTLLLVPAQVRAVAAARTRLRLLRRATTDVRLVVCGSTTAALGADAVAAALDLPLVAAMPAERRLASWLDQGMGPIRRQRGPLARACATTLAAVQAPGAGAR